MSLLLFFKKLSVLTGGSPPGKRIELTPPRSRVSFQSEPSRIYARSVTSRLSSFVSAFARVTQRASNSRDSIPARVILASKGRVSFWKKTANTFSQTKRASLEGRYFSLETLTKKSLSSKPERAELVSGTRLQSLEHSLDFFTLTDEEILFLLSA